MNKIIKAATAAAITAALAVSLSGCFGGSEDNGGTVVPYNPTPSDTPLPVNPTPQLPVKVVAPITLSVEDLTDNVTLSLIVGDKVDLLVPNDPVGWTAVSSDEAVATATDGYADSTAAFNPGIAAVGAGNATITVTGPDGTAYKVSVMVVEPNSGEFDPGAVPTTTPNE